MAAPTSDEQRALALRRWRRPLSSRPQQVAIVMVGVLVLALAGVEAVVMLQAGLMPWYVILAFVGMGALNGVLGTVAWLRRPGNFFGVLLILTGVAFLAAGAGFTGTPELIVVSLVLESTPVALIMHQLHAFPSGRLVGWSRPIMAATYFTSLVLQVPTYIWLPQPPPYDVMPFEPNERWSLIGERIQNGAGLIVFTATVVLLVSRLRKLDAGRRRVYAPLLGYGALVVFMQPFWLHVVPLLGGGPYATFFSQIITFSLLPFAFVLCLLLGGFGRTTEIQQLGAWLGTGPASRHDVSRALVRTLGDPTVELWFWVRGAYVDADGREIDPARVQPSPDRGVVPVELTGDRIGAISYDATLITDRNAVEAAGRVIALAVDRERLTAELLAARESLRQTLARVVESGDAERRRIARDLHDGLQSRLVLMGMAAFQITRDPTASPSIVEAVESLRSEVAHGIEELRSLVAGVMPATLMERGLFAATEDFVESVPVRTTLTVSGSRDHLPSAVESAAYFLVTEAVTNALKHARADALNVDIGAQEDLLRIEVSDNGVGGAERSHNGGLTGLADRIGALGGRFEVKSVAGEGTKVMAEVPCASS